MELEELDIMADLEIRRGSNQGNTQNEKSV